MRKKAKELIELSEETQKPKKIVSPQPIQQTQQLRQKNTLANTQQETQTNIVKNEVKKASDYFKVPVEHKNAAPKTIDAPKKIMQFKMTYLDNQKKQPQKIFVKNEITENMITYHYLGARVPTKLTISFNDEEPIIVLQNKKMETMHNTPFSLMPGNMFKAKVYYQFDVGGLIYRKGRKLTYKMNTPVEKITTQFSWHKPEKIIIKEAELITFYDI